METILATYRVQLHAGFRLTDLRGLITYLAQLGVTHVYLSPILHARAGSTHGYDVVDPTALNPELGSESDLKHLVDALHRERMGLVLDIVPNHMATGSENRFWEDVLSHGPCSRFADWFDIDWGPPGARRPYRIFLPVLGDRLARVIARGELRPIYRGGDFRIEYFEQSFPIDPGSLPLILETGLPAFRQSGASPTEVGELEAVIAALRSIPPRSSRSPTARTERQAEAEQALAQLNTLHGRSAAIRAYVESASAAFAPPDPGSARRLRRLLAAQAYRLAYWRRAAREINYRRFFTISHLIALRMEDPAVFAATHARILEWIREGVLDGLRVDHIDGLLDPRGYLERLRDAVAQELPSDAERGSFPTFVEKILARDERLPDDWPVAGTTGYDFLAELEDVFLDPHGYQALQECYREFSGRDIRFREVVRRSKRMVLDRGLAADLQRLARRLAGIAAMDPRHATLDRERLSRAICETIVCLPVYRTYIDPRGARYRPADRAVLAKALDDARTHGRADATALELLRDALLLERRDRLARAELAERIGFVQRFQQTSVAVAAKGVEDTAFYVYVPLVSRNEVGGEPDAPLANADSVMHEANQRQARQWPLGMLCTSTHDTKRSADVRARLDVLSELADVWCDHVRRWHRWNRRHRTRIRWRYAPDRNSEYLLYQTLVGIWPLACPTGRTGEQASSPQIIANEFRERVEAYMEKAARETKQHTSWIDPNPAFEAALRDFVRALLSPSASARFLADLDSFVQRIARPGLWNALARTLVQLTAPGAPDIYQGDELWNFSLVDPDNRRPVDFQLRHRLLVSVSEAWGRAQDAEHHRLLSELVSHPEDGRIKLHVISRALQARRAQPDLYLQGTYELLAAAGPAAHHVFAFARRSGAQVALILVPRRVTSLCSHPSTPPIGRQLWSGTTLNLPEGLATGRWENVLTGETLAAASGPRLDRLAVANALERFPVALLLHTC
ncbi:MAG: hypothetical protein AMS25_01325 [Gemmatimonas sp. SM23_52]|nr:MAG: hypothetical protein AMS25_01325 [Gemmatimonas sp. SM23_52]